MYSLAGLIPSVTSYGQRLECVGSQHDSFKGFTTGHATTTAAVVMMIEKSMDYFQRHFSDEIVGFLGLGSIGSSVLDFVFTLL